MKYEITEEQLKQISADGCTYVEQWFPNVFKKELEVGKWYWHDGHLFNYQLGEDVFGFNEDGSWCDCRWSWPTKTLFDREATESEVFEALKDEAVKRGFVSGTWISWEKEGKGQIKGDIYWAEGSECIAARCCPKTTERGNENFPIFKDGIWAEIIETITKSEAEKQLGKKIID